MTIRGGRRTGLPRLLTVLIGLVALGLAAAIVGFGGTAATRVGTPAGVRPGSVVWLIVLAAIAAIFCWFVFRVHRLNLRWLGLSAPNIPAVPFWLSELPTTISQLLRRRDQNAQADDGLSTVWTIGDVTATAYAFMGMGYSDPTARAADPRTRLPLDRPDQFSMAWTTFGGTQAIASREWLKRFAVSLDNPADATRQFWPNIASFGLPYNLIILQRVDAGDRTHKTALASDWTPKMEAVWQAGNLYVIDMTLFARFPANVVNFNPRFTPGTFTFLERDPVARTITPFAVRVADSNGTTVQYADGDPAWIYALQAAKTSIGVWGIWIGHVYHWHIVTAAMQMTMFQHLPADHPVSQVFGRQSEYLIAFDQFLLLDWAIAPPTSVTSSRQFLQLMDAFAQGRNFFDDDPQATLDRLRLRKQDFSSGGEDWNEYPVVRYLLTLFTATQTYVDTVVDAFYPDDASVAADHALRRWIKTSGARRGGNVRGLPDMTSRAELKRVLTSLIYRVTAHGSSRLNQAANPALTFAANFPPCLQDTTIPPPDTPFVFKADGASPPGAMSLARFLPNTGTIGELAAFLFTFVYSPPYKPFIPLDGIREDLPFVQPPPATAEVCNEALVRYRTDLQSFIALYASDFKVPGPPAQINQWELSIET